MDNETAFYIAQGISVFTALLAMLSVQLKGMKQILITQIGANLLAAVTYFLLGGLSGAMISIVAVVHALIMYFYNLGGKKPHFAVTGAFILVYVLNSALTFKSAFDILPAAAAVCFALALAQTRPVIFRFFSFWNPLLWIIYDGHTLAYGNLLTHMGIFISVVVACVRYDGFFGLFKRKKEKNNIQ